MNKIDRGQYSMIWIQIDRVGLEYGWQKLPAEIVDNDVVAKLKAFAQSGGNLFLTKHATELSAAIGRVDNSLAPGIFSSGEGGSGTDYWTTNAVIGSNQNPKYDHRSHAAFAGLEVLPANDPSTITTMSLILWRVLVTAKIITVCGISMPTTCHLRFLQERM